MSANVVNRCSPKQNIHLPDDQQHFLPARPARYHLSIFVQQSSKFYRGASGVALYVCRVAQVQAVVQNGVLGTG